MPKLSSTRALAAVLFGIVSLLAACSSTPKFKTVEGCGIVEYNPEWLKINARTVSWSGKCSSGLAMGTGKLEITLNDNRRILFNGKMEEGWIKEGERIDRDGWRYVGTFLYHNFISGQIYVRDALLFDGMMAHNKKDPTGKLVTFDDQRYFEGKLYFPDGSRIEDGRFDLSAGVFTGIKSINPQTGQGLIWGRYFKNNELVYRLANGKLHSTDISYYEAQSAQLNRDMAEMSRENEAYLARQREKDAKERREALALLSSTLSTMAGSQSASSRASGSPIDAAPSASGDGNAVCTDANAMKMPPGTQFVLDNYGNPCSKYKSYDHCITWAPGRRETSSVYMGKIQNVCPFPIELFTGGYSQRVAASSLSRSVEPRKERRLGACAVRVRTDHSYDYQTGLCSRDAYEQDNGKRASGQATAQ